MKSSGQLARKTPLKRGSKPLRRTQMARVGPKFVSRTATLPQAKAEVRERSGGRCEFSDLAGLGRCTDRSAEVHHCCLADRPAGRHEADRMLDLCKSHHDYVHAHPTESYANGWLIRRHAIEET